MLLRLPLILVMLLVLQTALWAHDHGGRPLRFIENKGQWSGPFLYKVDVPGATAFLEIGAITWVKLQHNAAQLVHDQPFLPEHERDQVQLAGHAWRMNFENVSADALVNAGEVEATSHNFFLGNDPAMWRSDVHATDAITYRNVWPGVDIHFRGSDHGNLKYDVILAPGIDPTVIAFSFEGLDGMQLAADGRLILSTSVGEVHELAPVAYHADDHSPVQSAFTLEGNKLGFTLAGHDPQRAIVIDPELIAATYSGTTTSSNNGHCATYDEEGNIYTGARSFGPGYPATLGAFQGTHMGGWQDMCFSKYNAQGSELIWASYLGGNDVEYPHGMVVNSQGQLCVLGSTVSTNFPVTSGAYQTVHGGAVDIVVTVFAADGTALAGSTFVGGSGVDGSNAMTANYAEEYRGELLVDDNGKLYVASFTRSQDFPTTAGTIQPDPAGLQDGVVFCLSPTVSHLDWSTHLGGAENDGAFGISLHEGDVIVCGQTFSNNFPVTAGAHQTGYNGGQEGFIVRLNSNATQIVASTYLGTPGHDRPYFVDLDTQGNIWVFGQSTTMPIQPDGVWGHVNGKSFLARLNPMLTQLQISTRFGQGSDNAMTPVAFRVDQCNRIMISAYETLFSNMPLTDDALQTTGAFYIAAFEPDVTGQIFGSHFGGDHVDGGTSQFDGKGILYQAACVAANGMNTTTDAYAPVQSGSWDVGVFKIQVLDLVIAAFTTDQDHSCSTAEVVFTNTSTGGLLEYIWDMGDGTQYTDTDVTHLFAGPGSYEVKLIAFDPSGCALPDSVIQTINVVLDPVLVEAVAQIVPPGPCGGMTVSTTNNSTGVAPTWQWHMGDGTVLQQETVTHTYTQPGEYTIMFVATDAATCNLADTLSWQVVVYPPGEAAVEFEVMLDQQCWTGVATTTNLSIGNGLQYHWDMGDGNEYHSFQVTHTYQQPGYYMITLSAVPPAGCAEPIPHYVPAYVGEPLPVTAGFALEFDHGCGESHLVATNYSGGDSVAYLWSFGDGNTSTEMHPTHLYTTYGELMLELVVGDLHGCLPNDTMQQAIFIPPPVVLDPTFEHVLMDNCMGGQFIGETMIDGPVEYIWEMGDGATLYANYIDHQYTVPGEYQVRLVAHDPEGCGSDTSWVTVQVVMPVIMDLSFHLEEQHGCGQTTVSCTNTSIGNNLAYIWWTSDDHSYYGPEMQHTFTQAGEYEIRFYGMDPMDCSGPDSVVVVVVVDPVVPVTAEFEMITSSDCNGTSVQFSTANTSEEITYAWSMGDGASFDSPVVQHGYESAGSYQVQLTVTDDSGCHQPQTSVQELQVSPIPLVHASFEVETGACGTMDLALISTSTGGAVELVWDMGDGQQLNGEAVAHTYSAPGTYAITLTASNPESCNISDVHQVAMTVAPVEPFTASFVVVQEGECAELTVNCTNTSIGQGYEHLWIFGNGATSTEVDGNHVITTPGEHLIQLVLTDPHGCLAPDTASTTVLFAGLMPLGIDILVEQTGDCTLMQVQCSNSSGGEGLQWLWDMGDGNQYNTFEAGHSYSAPGNYNVSLTVYDAVCQRQEILVVPVAVTDGVPVIRMSSDVICPGSAVILDAGGTPGSYSWNNGSNQPVITISTPGIYSVTVVGADGCTGTASVLLQAGVEQHLVDTIRACPNAMVELAIPVEGQAFAWSHGGMQRVEYVPGAGTYDYYVTDSDGCQHSGSFIVEASETAQLFAPNAFTPDGDGVNDVFTIYGHGHEVARLTIYNRWGDMLHQSKESQPTWDGYFNGSVVGQDVYVYQLEYRSTCTNLTTSTTGHVTVLR